MGSAKVSISVIDQSQPVAASSTSIPAGVIGTADFGPAYVPVNFSVYQGQFTEIFGTAAGGAHLGPIAVNEWLKGADNVTYVRILGIGDGKRRSSSTGQVTNAGFVAGEQQVQSSGLIGTNQYATLVGGATGRTYFLGTFMSESAGSTIFSSAGYQVSGENKAIPIVRGIILAASGVSLTLSGNYNSSNAPSSTSTAPNGGITGSVSISDSKFTILLNGFIENDKYTKSITSSFDFDADNHVSNILNRDLDKLEQAGHCLYSWYSVPTTLAAITGSGIFTAPTTKGDITKHDTAFITTGSLARDTSNASVPNFENFRERYTTPKTPFIVSQGFGGSKYPLFRFHTLDDGAVANSAYRIAVSNITPSSDDNYDFGTFSISVYDISPTIANLSSRLESESKALATFSGLTLDPSSPKYIASAIGDQHTYFDFDRAESSQKIVIEGDYPVTNNYIRVELSSDLIAGNVPDNALPMGFRGYGSLNTSGSVTSLPSTNSEVVSGQSDAIARARIPPVPYKTTVTQGGNLEEYITWGTHLETQTLDNPNAGVFDESIYNFSTFFPSFHPTNANFLVENSTTADTFANNLFTLENVKVYTASSTYADPDLWNSASYIRQGNITADAATKTRAFSVADLENNSASSAIKYAKFSLLTQGGFDGVNIFNADKRNLENDVVRREIVDSTNQGGATSGPTVVAYKKAIDIMGSKADTDIQILTIPGIRHPTISNYALSAIENRFDAMYIMDIEEYNQYNVVITGSDSANIGYTATAFDARSLNSSFGAAYFPDVTILDPDDGISQISVPPSVAVLGAYASNDSIGSPWTAPAGTTRGTLGSVIDVNITLEETNLDTLYDVNINPIAKFASIGPVVWGQKTLLRRSSALDRVNVRRLLIYLRRKVRLVANKLLFEPNTKATLDKFNSLVAPILTDVKNRGGVERYKVQIDTTTTTQADIENNTIRGKIFIQPTKAAEFISIDFVVAGRTTSLE